MLKENNLYVILIVILTVSVSLVSPVCAISDTHYIDVVETRDLRITFVPVDSPSDIDTSINNAIEFLYKTYPIKDNGII